MSTMTVILIVVAAAAIGFAVFMYYEKQRTRRLQSRFGPEYDREVDRHGTPRKAEAELIERQKRVERFHIRELSHTESDRFSEAWRSVQARFVDDPRAAVAEADRLVREVMTMRGYPMGDFEQRAADISVDHPRVVKNYRAAHDIAARDATGRSGTEDLRQAMVHYRALFD